MGGLPASAQEGEGFAFAMWRQLNAVQVGTLGDHPVPQERQVVMTSSQAAIPDAVAPGRCTEGGWCDEWLHLLPRVRDPVSIYQASEGGNLGTGID